MQTKSRPDFMSRQKLSRNLVSTEGRTRAQVATKIEVATEHLGRDKNNSFKRVVRVATTQLCHKIPDVAA